MTNPTDPQPSPGLRSEITCPRCHHRTIEEMPTNACRFFYECERCHTLLRPKTGDCCVFCSYGSVPCPPIQLERRGRQGNDCCGATDYPAACQDIATDVGATRDLYRRRTPDRSGQEC